MIDVISEYQKWKQQGWLPTGAAFALINALDEGQRKQAILNYKVADLVHGTGAGRKDDPAGGHQEFRDEREPACDEELASALNDLKAKGLIGEWRFHGMRLEDGMPVYEIDEKGFTHLIIGSGEIYRISGNPQQARDRS